MVFFTSVLKISNHFIHFSLRNGELDVKKNTYSRRKNVVLLFFIGENNKWIKKFFKQECVA